MNYKDFYKQKTYKNIKHLAIKQMIKYVIGDATNPIDTKNEIKEGEEGEDGEDGEEYVNEIKIIIHVCNDINRWGKGFVLAVSKKWKEPAIEYHKMSKKLGDISVLKVEENVYVANMIGQHGIYAKTIDGKLTQPIRYDALKECIEKVVEFVQNTFPDKYVSFHMPRIGCGLAGGKWFEVEKIISTELKNYNVVVYDLPK